MENDMKLKVLCKCLIFSIGTREWKKVYDAIQMLQLPNTRGQLLIHWKSEGNSWACNRSCRAFTAAGNDGLWCIKNISIGDGEGYKIAAYLLPYFLNFSSE